MDEPNYETRWIKYGNGLINYGNGLINYGKGLINYGNGLSSELIYYYGNSIKCDSSNPTERFPMDQLQRMKEGEWWGWMNEGRWMGGWRMMIMDGWKKNDGWMDEEW